MEFISDGLYGLFVHCKVQKHSKPHPSVTPEANTTKSFGPNLQPQHLFLIVTVNRLLIKPRLFKNRTKS